MKKDSLIKGTLILALAAFTARFLGMIVRAPLMYLLGTEGMASYVIANNIYLVLLIIATAGIPSALSKLISEKMALNKEDEAQQIFRAAVTFSISAGIIVTVFFFGAAPFIAQVAENPASTLSIRALAPALLLFPTIAIMRGYFQGRQMMLAGGLSQIFEQFARVGTAVGVAYILVALGYHAEWVAAGASFGGVAGAVVAFLVMLYYWRKLKKSDAIEQQARLSTHTSKKLNKWSIYKNIFNLSLPIAIFSMAVPLVNAIDSSSLIFLLKDNIGLSAATDALALLGGKAQPIAGIPPILATALSMSILPIVSSAFAKNDLQEVATKSSQTFQISILSGLPLVLMIALAARPINGLLFPDTAGTTYIIWMTSTAMFQIVMMTSGSVLMGLGKSNWPMIHVLIGITVKIAGSFLLAPTFGIYGVMAGTTLCFIVTMALNMRRLKKLVNYEVLGRRWIGVLISIISVVIVGLLLEWGAAMTPLQHKLGYALQAGMIGVIVLLLYAIMLWRTKVITADELRLFPAPVRKAVQIAGRLLKR